MWMLVIAAHWVGDMRRKAIDHVNVALGNPFVELLLGNLNFLPASLTVRNVHFKFFAKAKHNYP